MNWLCGCAASRAESLWLSVLLIRNKERLRLGRPSRQNVAGLTESQRLSAREAAQPHTHHKVSFSYLLAEQKEALW